MKTRITYSIVLLAMTLGSFLGFNVGNDSNGPRSRNKSHNSHYTPVQTPVLLYSVTVYTDDFDGDNSVTGLTGRGYKAINNSDPVGTTDWFQGNPDDVFPSYNGPANGYVAANFDNTGDNGTIDNWLIFPRVVGGILPGDSLTFWSRSADLDEEFGNYVDSIRVYYSANGDSTVAGSWTELGRFMVNNPAPGDANNGYIRNAFRAPALGLNGRFAIVYHVSDAGFFGKNSDFIGIDAARIERAPTGISPIGQIAESYSLKQNYPNPFNPTTKITFALPVSGLVTLKVYDMVGKEVADLVNGQINSGSYSVDFNASALPSGIYFYTIRAGNFSDTKKMMLVK